MVDWNTFMRESLINMMPSQEKRTAEIIKILEDNKITNVVKINNIEEEAMEISRQQSKKNKEERTPSEKMQDELETIPCPMHEDYDDKKDND